MFSLLYLKMFITSVFQMHILYFFQYLQFFSFQHELSTEITVFERGIIYIIYSFYILKIELFFKCINLDVMACVFLMLFVLKKLVQKEREKQRNGSCSISVVLICC